MWPWYRRKDEDFAKEIHANIELDIDQHIAEGLSHEEARAAALRAFGNVTRVQERFYESRRILYLDDLGRDVVYALRMMRRNPGFATVAILTLALGIGATTAMFSVVNAVLLRPLPYPDADRLVVLGYTFHGAWVPGASEAKFHVWQHHGVTFQDLSAVRMEQVDMRSRVGTDRVQAGRITASFLQTLAASVSLGHLFSERDDRPESDRVVILSAAYHQRRFGGSQDVLGQHLWINGDVHTVIGVLARSFDSTIWGIPPDVWIPLQLDPGSTSQPPSLQAIARLAAGASLASANAEARLAGDEFRRIFPEATSPTDTFAVAPFQDVMVGGVRSSLLVFMGAVVLVLLVACANVANLTLARSTVREREIAIRTSLGAGRGRMIRQLLAESLMLAVVGGTLGLVVGIVSIRAILAMSPSSLPRLGPGGTSVGMDWRVFAFAVTMSVIATVVSGLWPAFRLARAKPYAVSLTIRDRQATKRENAAREWLATIELALALVLVMGTALLIRTFVALRTADRGFESSRVLTIRMSLNDPRFATTHAVAQLVRDGVARVGALPGVASVAAAVSLPLESDWLTSFQIIGRPSLSSPGLASQRIVAPAYFDVLGIRLINGRAVADGDREGGPSVAIINATMARQFWPARSPVGDRLVLFPGFVPADDPPRVIVGVASDVRDGLPLSMVPRPTVYVPLAQVSDRLLHAEPLAWVIRAQTEPMVIAKAVEQELERAGDALPTFNLRSMDAITAESAAPTRFITVLMTAFSSSALLLAVVGVYGVLAYLVMQRTNEIGIRMALGAQPRQILALVLRKGLSLTTIGILLGLVGAAASTRLLQGMLFGTTPLDPKTFVAVSLMFSLVATLASYVPARRATKVDPMVALRCE